MNILKKMAVVVLRIFVAGALVNRTLPRVSYATNDTSVGSTPTASTPVTVVNTVTQPVPVYVHQKLLHHQGTFFKVGAGGSSNLVVPAGVVLTDADLSFSIPAPIPNAASLFIQDGAGNSLVYQIVNNITFEAGISFGTGIPSTGSGLKVQLSCYNISGNQCTGAIMWSGYTP